MCLGAFLLKERGFSCGVELFTGGCAFSMTYFVVGVVSFPKGKLFSCGARLGTGRHT
jgi:branched-subunit amino acid ABC-type transport system permease component